MVDQPRESIDSIIEQQESKNHQEVENSKVDEVVEETSTEEEESSDEETSDEEDEEPPLFKYERLSKLPKTFFSKELVTSSLIHESLFAFGTSSGLLHVTTPSFETIGTIRSRKSPILSIHTDGFTIIACSMDGTIMISNTLNFTAVTAYDLKVPTYCVVINGNYKDTKSFIYGNKNGQVIQSTVNWLGSRTERSLYEDEEGGAIVKLEIIGDLLIIFNDIGMIFYNLIQGRIIQIFKRNSTTPAELIWPKTCLIEGDRIVIGWCDKIWCFKFDGLIKEYSSPSKNKNFKLGSTISSFNSKQDITIHQEFQFRLDPNSLICGIGSFRDDCLVVLTIEAAKDKLASPPELRIINLFNHEEVSTDEIILKNFQKLRVNDLQLGQSINKTFNYYIICSTDGIIGKEIDLKGRFDWFIEKKKYYEAWDISEHLISEKERVEIGIKQVEKILAEEDNENNWEDASKFLSKVLKDIGNTELLLEKWDQWSWIFIHSHKYILLASILPINKSLPDIYYNECLYWFLENNPIEFIKYLNAWDSLCDFDKITKKTELYLEINPNEFKITRNLLELYLKHEEFNKSIPYLIKLKDDRTMQILSENHLLQQYFKELPIIIKYEISQEELKYGLVEQIQEKSLNLIDILVSNRHEIIPLQFIELMDSNDLEIISFLYLKKLSKIDEFSMIEFETEMVSLYSKFEPQSLLKYLKHKQHYDIDKAMEIMSSKGYYKELVYLLGKIGKSKEAMILLIDEMDDSKRAVEFAIESKNEELWEILITKGLHKPKFLKALIEDAGEMLDSKTIRKVPKGVEIDGLKELLIDMFNKNSLSLSLQKAILKIVDIEGVKNGDVLNNLRISGKVYTTE